MYAPINGLDTLINGLESGCLAMWSGLLNINKREVGICSVVCAQNAEQSWNKARSRDPRSRKIFLNCGRFSGKQHEYKGPDGI